LNQKQYNPPGLFTINAEEYPIPGPLLLELLQAVISKGVPFRFKARGWSMTPFIRDGDVITVSPFSRSDLSIGSIVAFKRPGAEQLVVHRIVAKHKKFVYTIGDGILNQADGWIPVENIIGLLTRIERNGRRVWLGLGLERYLIAYFSRKGWLNSLNNWMINLRNIAL
jgi:hypothetical protein